ncbi:MAG: hypothetical protein OEZ36_01560 [Spirochaetota bacterium]|nr:hypothetical protein [Spirochaetota bacterium]
MTKQFMKNTIVILLLMILSFFSGKTVSTQNSTNQPFNKSVKSITDLIPMDSSTVLILTELQKNTAGFLKHPLSINFKKLKLTEELFYDEIFKPVIKMSALFKKYSKMTFDMNLFFRLFGKEAAFYKANNSYTVITRLGAFAKPFKQALFLISRYSKLKDKYASKTYKSVTIEKLSLKSNNIFYTFLGDILIGSTEENNLIKIINHINGNRYNSISSKKGFNQSLMLSRHMKYPVILYENKRLAGSISHSKGEERLSHFFTERFWKFSFSYSNMLVNYEYRYSPRALSNPLSNIKLKNKVNHNNIEANPSSSIAYISTNKINTRFFYDWFYKSWLVNSQERSEFNNTFDQVQEKYAVDIREMIQKDFDNEMRVIFGGLGYQGLNPFPKLAFIIKIKKGSNPAQKMKAVFNYMFKSHHLKYQQFGIVPIYYFISNKKFGQRKLQNKNKNLSSQTDFSPSFTFTGKYLIISFNKDLISQLLQHYLYAKRQNTKATHRLFWKNITKPYDIIYFIDPADFSTEAKSYLAKLDLIYKKDFIISDTKKRLTPLLGLLRYVSGIGGGLNLGKDKLEGDIIFKLQ